MAALGARPLTRHLMSTNFSKPRSAPKPASVTTKSAQRTAIWSATIELLPCAMLPKGPAWMKAGVFSIVCRGWA
jgi:hypothetical protein